MIASLTPRLLPLKLKLSALRQIVLDLIVDTLHKLCNRKSQRVDHQKHIIQTIPFMPARLRMYAIVGE